MLVQLANVRLHPGGWLVVMLIYVWGVLESSGWADFKTVPGFAFRAIFEGDIEGFTPLKVMLATTV